MKYGNPKHIGLAFTLIEVVASVAILVILLGSVFVIHHGTSGSVITQTLRQRAMSVAQRQMEILIATRQEPDSDETSGWDEFDPLFQWHIGLQRESFSSSPPKPDLSNTVIKATVTVEWDDSSNQSYDFEELDYTDEYDGYEEYEQDEDDWDEEDWNEEDWQREQYQLNRKTQERLREVSTKIELVRYFEHTGFKPIAGEPVAVPMTREIPPEPQWYIDLIDRLGREPTPQEVIQEMFKQGNIPLETMDELDFGEDDEQEEDEEVDEDDGDSMTREDILDLEIFKQND